MLAIEGIRGAALTKGKISGVSLPERCQVKRRNNAFLPVQVRVIMYEKDRYPQIFCRIACPQLFCQQFKKFVAGEFSLFHNRDENANRQDIPFRYNNK